jgi:hypothetical protein
MTPNFTPADLDTILDALDELERKDLEFLPSIEKLLKILPEPRCEEHHQAYSDFRKDLLGQEAKMKKQKKMARERITLLKAKIIMLQQAAGVEQLFDEASKPIEDEEGSPKKAPKKA